MLSNSTLQDTAGAAQIRDINNDQAALLQQLITESQNEASQGLDTKSALEIARIINHEDAKVAARSEEGDRRRSPQSSTRWRGACAKADG